MPNVDPGRLVARAYLNLGEVVLSRGRSGTDLERLWRCPIERRGPRLPR
jgi:hypothetical protein